MTQMYDRQGLFMVTRSNDLLADLKIRFHLLVFQIQGGEDPWDALSLQDIFRQRAP